MKQSEMDFERGDQLWLLDHVPIASGEVKDGRSVVAVSAASARSVLRAIDAHARVTGQCWAASKTIAAATSRHERTVRRAMRLLESYQLILVDWRSGRSPKVVINWGEISIAAKNQIQRKTIDVNPGHFFANRGHSDTNRGHSDTNRGHSDRRSVEKRIKKRTTPPTPSISTTPDVASLRDDSREAHASATVTAVGEWHLVARSLRKAGVSSWRALVSELQERERIAGSHEINAAHAQAICDHFESHPGAWGPVALVARLRSAHADTSPESLWWTVTQQWNRAESIRDRVRSAAVAKGIDAEDVRVHAAIARRLSESDLSECIRSCESEAREQLMEAVA